MDPQKHDKQFFVTFMAVIGVLAGITLTISFIARTAAPAIADPEVEAKQLEGRIAPVGQVVTDPAALLKLAAAAPARAPMSGADVVAKVCSGCHQTGMLGAPKIGDHGEWNKRKSARGGIDGLLKSAVNGRNQMPPRGGDPSLSDAELKAAIELMSK